MLASEHKEVHTTKLREAETGRLYTSQLLPNPTTQKRGVSNKPSALDKTQLDVIVQQAEQISAAPSVDFKLPNRQSARSTSLHATSPEGC
ncbi:MAG: hypothetical protein P3M72_00160 [Candidatus Hodgkinia cicadicola]|nr:MAG: hypothetical protein P3M72_00160 [Candidatus Hodgkinia cicadicola]